LIAKPPLDRRDHVRLFSVGQRLAARNFVPLRQTSATASRRCMLGNEYRMTAKWRLLPVVPRRSGRESPSDQLLGLDENTLESTRFNVLPLRHAEAKAATEG
jgi:hypothetical protein